MDPSAYSPNAPQYAGFISQASAAYGVPANILAAQIQTESSFNPNAVGGAGEIGLMQISPGLATSMGLSSSQLYDPQTNINAGASYLASLFGKFGDWGKALQAYNAGPAAATAGSSVGAGYASGVLGLAANTGAQVDPASLASALGSTTTTPAAPSGAANTVNIPGVPGWINGALSWLVNHLIMLGAIALAVILIFWGILSLFKAPLPSAVVNISKGLENASPEIAAAA